jgi:hypothetical protein
MDMKGVDVASQIVALVGRRGGLRAEAVDDARAAEALRTVNRVAATFAERAQLMLCAKDLRITDP